VKYWVCVTTEENWKIIRKSNIWGVPERARRIIENVEPGDMLAIYVIQTRLRDKIVPSRFVGIFEASSKPFYDESKLFVKYKGKAFPYRIRLKPVRIFHKPLYVKSLVPRLSFIRNKRFWTVYFRRAMFEIPKEDFATIISEAE